MVKFQENISMLTGVKLEKKPEVTYTITSTTATAFIADLIFPETSQRSNERRR